MALPSLATAVSPSALDKQHRQGTDCPGQGDKSHNPATFTLRDGGISQLLPETWISSQAPKQQVVHMPQERGRSKGGSTSGPRGAGMEQRDRSPAAELLGFPLAWGASSRSLEMVETQGAQKTP